MRLATATFPRPIPIWRARFLRLALVLAVWIFSTGCPIVVPEEPPLVQPSDCQLPASDEVYAPEGPTAAVGSVEGQFAVNDSGSATYEMTIEVPPGRAGIQPRLALTYGSDRGGGSAGLGFGLAGLSAVSRCPKTVQADGELRPVKLDAKDAVCLDGSRLWLVSGTHLESAEYRTRPDSFRQVKSRGLDSAKGPSFFTVKDKTGRTLTYGGRPDAVIYGPGGVITEWSLASVEDRFGNTMTYHYEALYAPSGTGDGSTWERNLTEVRYGGHEPTELEASRFVRLTYEDRPDRARGYRKGHAFEVRRRLQRIETFVATTRVREYRLAYTNDGSNHRSKVQSVTECADNGICKPATRFEWAKRREGFGPREVNDATIPITTGHQGGHYGNIAMDVDGDGLDDIVYPDNEYWNVVFARSVNAKPYERVVRTTAPSGDLGASAQGTPFDYNLDGRMDLLLHTPNGTAADEQWQVLVSTGSGFTLVNTGIRKLNIDYSHPSQHKSGTLLVDLNGDGVADLLSREPRPGSANNLFGRWVVRLHDGTGFGPPIDVDPTIVVDGVTVGLLRGSVSFIPMDWDGDGRTDLFTYSSFFPGSTRPFVLTFENGAFTVVGGPLDTRFPETKELIGRGVRPLDVNGDGLTDLVVTHNDATDPGSMSKTFDLTVFINTGNGFIKHEKSTRDFPVTGEHFYFALTIDYDGDGDDDLLIPHNRARTASEPEWWYLVRFDGASYTVEELPIRFSSVYPVSPKWTFWSSLFTQSPRLADSRGSGMRDLIGLDSTGHVVVHPHLRSEIRGGFGYQDAPDVVVEVRDGRNRITDGGGQPATPGVATVRIDYVYLRDIDAWNDSGAKGVTRPALAPSASPRGGADAYTARRDCRYPQRCVVGGLHVVAAHHVDWGSASKHQPPNVWSTPMSTVLNERHVVHAYADGRSDRLGLGWLGFSEHTLWDIDADVVDKRTVDNNTFDAVARTYPFAGITKARVTFGRGVGSSPPWFQCHTSDSRLRFTYDKRSYFVEESWAVAQDFEGKYLGDHWTVNPQSTCLGSTGAFRTVNTYRTHDDFGNVTEQTQTFSGLVGFTRTRRQFTNDTSRWLIGLMDDESTTDATADGSLTRYSKMFRDPETGAILRTDESADGSEASLRTEYIRNVYGNLTYQKWTDGKTVERAACVGYGPTQIFPFVTRNSLRHATFLASDPRFGTAVRVVDKNFRTTRTQLDAFGRVVAVDNPDGTKLQHVIASEFVAGESLTKVRTTQTGQPWTESQLDRLGRAVRSTALGLDGAPIHKDQVFGVLGAPNYTSLPYKDGAIPSGYHQRGYDDRGRLLEHFLPNGSVIRQNHGPLGVTRIDPKGNSTLTVNDSRDRIRWVVDALGGETHYAYGPFGAPSRITDPKGNVTLRRVDGYGRLAWLSDPDGGQWSVTYTGFGEPRTIEDGNGDRTFLTYDRIGRLVARSDKHGTSRWRFDPAGNLGALESAESASGHAQSWKYDAVGRVVETTARYADGASYTKTVSYDASSRVDVTTYPGGFRTRNGYAIGGHWSSVSDADTGKLFWQAARSDEFGHFTQEVYGNGAVADATFDPLTGLLSAQRTRAPAGPGATATIQELRLEYDPNFNIAMRADDIQGRSEFFRYDALNRLTLEVFRGVQRPAVEIEYHADGNIKTRDGASYDYDPKHPHAVAKWRGHTYAYDSNGDQILRDDLTLSYFNHLPLRIARGSEVVAEFQYDASRVRVRRLVHKSDGAHQTDYFGGYQRDDGPAGAMHRYLIASPVGVVAEVRQSALKREVLYLHRDRLGSTDVVSDESGAVAERHSYDAFGAPRNPAWGSPGAPTYPIHSATGFTAHEDEPDLGFVNMRGRIYDPAVGRFLTPDPALEAFGRPQSLNAYSYVANNPLTLTDPSGYSSTDFKDDAEGVWVEYWKYGRRMCVGTSCPIVSEYVRFSDMQQKLTSAMQNDSTNTAADQGFGRILQRAEELASLGTPGDGVCHGCVAEQINFGLTGEWKEVEKGPPTQVEKAVDELGTAVIAGFALPFVIGPAIGSAAAGTEAALGAGGRALAAADQAIAARFPWLMELGSVGLETAGGPGLAVRVGGGAAAVGGRKLLSMASEGGGGTAAGALPKITSGSQVTEAVIREAMKDAPLLSQQSRGVSLPMIRQYVDKLLAGGVAPAIKVDGKMIVDGNHRYIAGRILGQEPAIQPWLGGRPANAVPWATLPINPEAW